MSCAQQQVLCPRGRLVVADQQEGREEFEQAGGAGGWGPAGSLTGRRNAEELADSIRIGEQVSRHRLSHYRSWIHSGYKHPYALKASQTLSSRYVYPDDTPWTVSGLMGRSLSATVINVLVGVTRWGVTLFVLTWLG